MILSRPRAAELRRALGALETDLTVTDFLARHFAEAHYAELCRVITRMAEGDDAAERSRASTFALREEWMGRGLAQQARLAEGHGALAASLRRVPPACNRAVRRAFTAPPEKCKGSGQPSATLIWLKERHPGGADSGAVP